MAHKGFIRIQDEDNTNSKSVKRLLRTGIPLKNIYSEKEFLPDAKWLNSGDYLVVCSLSDLHSKPEALLRILSTFLARKINIRSLDEPWYDTDSDIVKHNVNGFAELFDVMRSNNARRQSEKKRTRGRPAGLTPVSLAKCMVCEDMLLSTNKPLLDILKTQKLGYATWRRYVQEYKTKDNTV